MSRRSLMGRMERLENGLGGGAVDLEAEAAEYGVLVWSGPVAGRCYEGTTHEGARLSIIGGKGGDLVYEIVGVDLGALSA